MAHDIRMFIPSTFKLFDGNDLHAVIDSGGIEKTSVGSDLGQSQIPARSRGWRR